MATLIDLYVRGEGYIVYLLLESLLNDSRFPICLRYSDRPLPGDGDLNLFLIPEPDEREVAILNALPIQEKVLILSQNCKGLKNCIEISGDYVRGALAHLLREILKKEDLAEEVLNTETPRLEKEREEQLLEKLTFYIPLGVAKRGSILFGWKYYLSAKGVPFVAYRYPFEEEAFLKVLSNVGFTDKVFPLLLGRTPDNFLAKVKQKGFVPFEVLLEARNNLLSELDYILLAREIAKKVKRI